MKKIPYVFAVALSVGSIPLFSAGPALAREQQNRAPHISNGETVRCTFKRFGPVIINTRPNQETITVRGKVRSAQSGSYFYQTRSGDIALMYTPNMKRWTYRSGQGREETTSNCTKRSNRPVR